MSIDLNAPPYDSPSVDTAYSTGGCAAVESLFATKPPAAPGECP